MLARYIGSQSKVRYAAQRPKPNPNAGALRNYLRIVSRALNGPQQVRAHRDYLRRAGGEHYPLIEQLLNAVHGEGDQGALFGLHDLLTDIDPSYSQHQYNDLHMVDPYQDGDVSSLWNFIQGLQQGSLHFNNSGIDNTFAPERFRQGGDVQRRLLEAVRMRTTGNAGPLSQWMDLLHEDMRDPRFYNRPPQEGRSLVHAATSLNNYGLPDDLLDIYDLLGSYQEDPTFRGLEPVLAEHQKRARSAISNDLLGMVYGEDPPPF